MIDGPNGVLMGVPRNPPHDFPPPAAPPPAPSAQEVSAAYQVVSHSLEGKALDGGNLAAAAREARRYGLLHDQAIAEAELEAIAQYNAQHAKAGPEQASEPAPAAKAAQQLGASGAFDSNTLAAAQHAFGSGDLHVQEGKTVESFNVAACVVGDTKPLPVALKNSDAAPSLADATDRLNAYLASGMSVPEAVGMLRVENGANPAAEDVIARAALASQAPAYLSEYAQAPDGPGPVELASAQIDKLGLFPGDTLARARQAMTIELPNGTIDGHAAQSAADKLAHDQRGSAQFTADMQAYRAALTDEITQASGKQGAAWVNDPANIDAWLKAEVAVAGANLSPAAQAAAAKPGDAPEHKALADQSDLLNLALEETRVIADVTDAAPTATTTASPASPASRAQSDLARTQRLTSDLSALGLVRFDEKSQHWVPAGPSKENPNAATMLADVLDDASIRTLKQHDIDDVMLHAGKAHAESADNAKADLRATSNALAPFKQGETTIFYADMVEAVQGSDAIQQRFDDIGGSVRESGAVGYVHAVAQTLQDVQMPGDADLTRALYQQKFRGRFEDFLAHGAWRAPSGLPALWQDLDAPKYYVDASNAYAALGDDTQAASTTPQGAALMNVVHKRMNGSDFVGRTYDGALTKNGPEEQIKSYYLNWKDKHGVWTGNAQLYQDIVQQDPHSDTARFIEAELPIRADEKASANAAPAYQAPDAKHAAGGTQIVTSRAQLINALGDAYQAKPLAHAAKEGVRYDGDTKVYGDTTIDQLAKATLDSQGVKEPTVESPLELTMLPLVYWRQGQDPTKDEPQALKLIQADGARGRRFVGPADAQTFDSYSEWTQQSGFGAGMMLSAQHLIHTPGGPATLWDQTLTGQEKPSNGEILLQAGEAMASLGAAAVVSFASPEAEGLLLPLLYDGAQTYFAATGVQAALDAADRIERDPTSAGAWAEGGWAVAANSFTALSIASHFGMTRLPSMLARAFEAGQAAQGDAKTLSLPTRLLVSAADNTAGAKTYMALAGAPDSVLAVQRVVLKGAALTNGVLLGTQGVELGAAWASGQPVSPAAVMQLIATVGMGQFGRLYHVRYSTNMPPARGDRAVETAHTQFEDPDAVAMAQFRALAAPYHLSEAAIADLGWQAPRDNVTFFFDARQGHVKADTVRRARAHVRDTENSAYYVSADIYNLGGLNAAFEDVAEYANVHYHAMAHIAREELEETGATVVSMRTGGDELGFVVVGAVDDAAIASALDSARERIASYAVDEGLDGIPHPKRKGEKGVGMHFGSAAILPGLELTDIFTEADLGVNRSKSKGGEGDRRRDGDEETVVDAPEADEPQSQSPAPSMRTPALPIEPFAFELRPAIRVADPGQAEMQEFVERARRHGLTDEQARRLAQPVALDDVSGFFDARQGTIKSKMVTRTRAYVKASGDRAYYVSGDIFNLGGLNAAMNDVAEMANAHYRAIVGIVADELARTSADVVPMRTGGDEIGIVVVGSIDEAALREGLRNATKRIGRYAKENGLADVAHPKRKGEFGVGMHLGYAPIDATAELSEIFTTADLGVNRSKTAQALLAAVTRERLRSIEPASDRRTVKLILDSGTALEARVLGGRGAPLPSDPADLLLPGRSAEGQRFELVRDADAGEFVVIPRARGGAIDEDPERAGGAPREPSSGIGEDTAAVPATLPERIRWSKARARTVSLSADSLARAGTLMDLRDDDRFFDTEVDYGDQHMMLRGRGTGDSRVYGVSELGDQPQSAAELVAEHGATFAGLSADRSKPLIVAVRHSAERLAPELANLLRVPTIAPARAQDVDANGEIAPDAQFVRFEPAPYTPPALGTLEIRDGVLMREAQPGQWTRVTVEEHLGPLIGGGLSKTFFRFAADHVLGVYNGSTVDRDHYRTSAVQERLTERRGESIGLKVVHTSAPFDAMGRVGVLRSPAGLVGSTDDAFAYGQDAFPIGPKALHDLRVQRMILTHVPADLADTQFVFTENGAYLSDYRDVRIGERPSEDTLGAIDRTIERLREIQARNIDTTGSETDVTASTRRPAGLDGVDPEAAGRTDSANRGGPRSQAGRSPSPTREAALATPEGQGVRAEQGASPQAWRRPVGLPRRRLSREEEDFVAPIEGRVVADDIVELEHEDDPSVLVRLELEGTTGPAGAGPLDAATVRVGDLYRGGLPKGSGHRLLMRALESFGIRPTERLVFDDVEHHETVQAHAQGIPAAETPLARTGMLALRKLGLEPASARYEDNSRGRWDIVIELASRHETHQGREAELPPAGNALMWSRGWNGDIRATVVGNPAASIAVSPRVTAGSESAGPLLVLSSTWNMAPQDGGAVVASFVEAIGQGNAAELTLGGATQSRLTAQAVDQGVEPRATPLGRTLEEACRVLQRTPTGWRLSGGLASHVSVELAPGDPATQASASSASAPSTFSLARHMPDLIVSSPRTRTPLTVFGTAPVAHRDFVVAAAVRDGGIVDAAGLPLPIEALAHHMVSSERFPKKTRVVLMTDEDAPAAAPALARLLRHLQVPVLARDGALPRGDESAWRLHVGDEPVAARGGADGDGQAADVILGYGNSKVAYAVNTPAGRPRVVTVPRDSRPADILEEEYGMLEGLRAEGIPVLHVEFGRFIGRRALFADRYATSLKALLRLTETRPRDEPTAQATRAVLRASGVPVTPQTAEAIARVRTSMLERNVGIADFDMFLGRIGEDGRADSSAVVADPMRWNREPPLAEDIRNLAWLESVVASGTGVRGSAASHVAPFDMQSVTEIAPTDDGRFVTLTDASGRSLDAALLGGRETPPTQADDVLMPDGEKRGQRFEALRDPLDGSLVIVPRVRGGAVDEDPEMHGRGRGGM